VGKVKETHRTVDLDIEELKELATYHRDRSHGTRFFNAAIHLRRAALFFELAEELSDWSADDKPKP
jgi:hypothetical protein